MPAICFETIPFILGDWTLLRLPENVSTQLPSHGLALVEGTIDGLHSKIEITLLKLKAGERRPYCVNRNQCTKLEVSKNGVLIEPGPAKK